MKTYNLKMIMKFIDFIYIDLGGQFSQLELALIIVSSILAAIVLGLLIAMFFVARRGRITLARF